MISPPFVTVQCDQEPLGVRRRVAVVFTLPTFQSSREAAGQMFLALHSDWHIGPQSGRVFCPQCKRIAEVQLAARRAAQP